MSELPVTSHIPILLDNTVLSNFAQVNSTKLVMDQWDSCATTRDAWREYQMGITVGKLPKDAWKGLPLLDMTVAEGILAAELSTALGAGERSCLAIAHGRHGLLITDDRKARQVALQMSVQVTGTLGILVKFVTSDRLNLKEANKLLADMIDKGFHSPINDLSGLLRDVP